MLKDVLTGRLFLGALACFILIVAGCTLYLWHAERELARDEARTADIVKRWNARNATPPENAPVASPLPADSTAQGGHWHGDKWPAAPHAAHSNSAMPTQSDTDERERKLQKRRELLAREKRLLQENAALKEKLAKIKAERAEFAAAKAVFAELKAGIDSFPDVMGITREEFSSMSDSEKAAFFQRVNEFEAFRLDISPRILALPEWILGELERQIPGALAALTLPPKDGVLWRLQAERLGVPHLGGTN